MLKSKYSNIRHLIPEKYVSSSPSSIDWAEINQFIKGDRICVIEHFE